MGKHEVCLCKLTIYVWRCSQLASLVKEKHEACARLKTLEDMMEAIRTENDILRHGLTSSSSPSNFTSSREGRQGFLLTI